MAIISRVEVIDFTYEIKNMGAAFTNAHNHVGYLEGGRLPMSKYAIVIECEDGSRGEYVTHWGGTRPALAQTLQLVNDLPGRDSDMREAFYNDWTGGHRAVGSGRQTGGQTDSQVNRRFS